MNQAHERFVHESLFNGLVGEKAANGNHYWISVDVETLEVTTTEGTPTEILAKSVTERRTGKDVLVITQKQISMYMDRLSYETFAELLSLPEETLQALQDALKGKG